MLHQFENSFREDLEIIQGFGRLEISGELGQTLNQFAYIFELVLLVFNGPGVHRVHGV